MVQVERVVVVSLSPLQRQYYQGILERNFGLLNGGVEKGGNKTSLLNIVMEARKCANHVYLFDSAVPTWLDHLQATKQMPSDVERLDLSSQVAINTWSVLIE